MSDGQADEQGGAEVGLHAADDPTAVGDVDDLRAAGYDPLASVHTSDAPPALPAANSLGPSMLIQDGCDPSGRTLPPAGQVIVRPRRGLAVTLALALTVGTIVFLMVRDLG